MRTIAVLSVVFAHYFASTQFKYGAFYGVEIFFVLSGFLIGGLLLRFISLPNLGPTDVWEFWVRRWLRTLPNYFIFLIVFTVMAWPWPHLSGMHWMCFLFFFQNFLWPPLDGFYGVSWSLAVEEWFYLLFPICVFVMLKKYGQKGFVRAILFFLLVPLLCRAIVSAEYNSLDDVRRMVCARLDSIIYGVLAAYIKRENMGLWRTRELRYGGLFLGLPLIALSTVWCSHGGYYSKLCCFPLASLAVSFTLPFCDGIQVLRSSWGRPVTFMSKVSYSTYLLHMPLFFLLNDWAARFYINTPVKLSFRLAFVVLAFVLSYVTYAVVERKFLALRDRLGKRIPASTVPNLAAEP